jgi:hypothetical protein
VRGESLEKKKCCFIILSLILVLLILIVNCTSPSDTKPANDANGGTNTGDAVVKMHDNTAQDSPDDDLDTQE